MHSVSVVRHGQRGPESLPKAASVSIADMLWTLLLKGWGCNRSESPVRPQAELVTKIPAASVQVTHLPLGAHLFSLLGIGGLRL